MIFFRTWDICDVGCLNLCYLRCELKLYIFSKSCRQNKLFRQYFYWRVFFSCIHVKKKERKKKKTSFPKIKMSILNSKRYKGMIASFRAKYLNKHGDNWQHVLLANRPCPIFWVWCFRGPLFQGWRWYINLWIKQMLFNNRNKSLSFHLCLWNMELNSKTWHWDNTMLNMTQTKTLSVKTVIYRL